MKRDRTQELIEWLNSSTRKPLIIRGARQVGKTWLIRDLAFGERHQFVKEKKKAMGVRINSDLPRKGLVNVKDSTGDAIEYTLLSIPFYLVGQLHRLIKSVRELF